MASAAENKAFGKIMQPVYPLDEALAWITENMRPDEVFDDEALSEWADNNNWEKQWARKGHNGR